MSAHTSLEETDTKQIIECSKSLGFFSGYFTLVRSDDNKVVWFVFTDEGPITDIEQVFPKGEPFTSLDWGYIYDRNGDGWADYFICFDNVLPVKTKEIAHLIPSHPGLEFGEQVTISGADEIILIFKHTKAVFTHNADDNFDGKTDGVVAPTPDSENPIWTYGNALFRSRSYTNKIDEKWRFFSDIQIRTGQVHQTSKGYYNITFYIDGNPLIMSTAILKSINKGIRKCHLPKGILPKE